MAAGLGRKEGREGRGEEEDDGSPTYRLDPQHSLNDGEDEIEQPHPYNPVQESTQPRPGGWG